MIRSLALAAMLALPLAAHAETPPAAPAPAPAAAPLDGTGFLVMDSERITTQTTAMKSVFDQMAKRRDVEAAAYNMALDKLDKEFEPIKQAKDTMDPAEYQKAVEQYNGIKAQIDGILAKVQEDMSQAGEKAIEQFNGVAKVVGEEIRKERGAARYVDGAAVLYLRPGSGYDVTDEMIKRVNARLPDIKVNFPPRQTPAAAPDKVKPAKPANKK